MVGGGGGELQSYIKTWIKLGLSKHKLSVLSSVSI